MRVPAQGRRGSQLARITPANTLQAGPYCLPFALFYFSILARIVTFAMPPKGLSPYFTFLFCCPCLLFLVRLLPLSPQLDHCSSTRQTGQSERQSQVILLVVLHLLLFSGVHFSRTVDTYLWLGLSRGYSVSFFLQLD